MEKRIKEGKEDRLERVVERSKAGRFEDYLREEEQEEPEQRKEEEEGRTGEG